MCRCWPTSVFSPAGRPDASVQTGAADLVNIKLMKCGGLHQRSLTHRLGGGGVRRGVQ
ncbi:MAG: hypothetical protein ACLVJH_04160 [Faecalibacterium prausnitzii]